MLSSLLEKCTSGTFATPPLLFGAEIISIDALLVTNFTANVHQAYRFTQPSISAENISFCNVTVAYTHPGTGDRVHIETWLPTEDGGWNERLYSVGGGGFAAGRFFLSYITMAGAVAEGYATSSTDAGLGFEVNPQDASPWVLLSPGNVDYNALRNLGSASLNDQAIISKDIIRTFYGREGGLMLAQRFPTAYDGIVAGAPALGFTKLAASIFWPQQQMNMLRKYPFICELDAIAQAAVAACDGLDGVMDNIVSDVDGCLSSFDPFQLVGTTINCSQTGSEMEISAAAATQIWHGFNSGADLTGSQSHQSGIASTNCFSNTCVGQPNSLGAQWLRLFVAKDPNFDTGNLTHEEFDGLVHEGRWRKMLTFHGLDDNVIPPKGTEAYYEAVAAILPDMRSFYRYFEVPGMAHCFGGAGGQPTAMFGQLRAWVENGTAPESSPISFSGSNGTGWSRVLCPFPERAQFQEDCGDVQATKCWACTANQRRRSNPLSSELKMYFQQPSMRSTRK